MKIVAIILLWLALPGLAVDLIEDPPLVKPPGSGSIGGTIEGAHRVVKLEAVSRVSGGRYSPAGFDRASGKFTFENMPGDAQYDLCLTLHDGSRLEGIDLQWFEARLQRLASVRRAQLGLPHEQGHVFTRDDGERLIRFFRERKDFSGLNRVLHIRGHGDKAVVLTERIRTGDFYDAAGVRHEGADRVIWRSDLWYFTFDAGGWRQLSNVNRLVERHSEFSPAELARFTLVYDPALSVRVGSDGDSPDVTYVVPEGLDPAGGRVAGEPLELMTQPFVHGVLREEE